MPAEIRHSLRSLAPGTPLMGWRQAPVGTTTGRGVVHRRPGRPGDRAAAAGARAYPGHDRVAADPAPAMQGRRRPLNLCDKSSSLNRL